MGKIQWYRGRAGSGYCFNCASSSCSHLNGLNAPIDNEEEERNNKNEDREESRDGIAWKAWLAKCVDSSPLVVARIDDTGSIKLIILSLMFSFNLDKSNLLCGVSQRCCFGC